MQEWQITVWMCSLMALMFCAGCSFGYTFSRNKTRKIANVRKR